MFCSAPYSLPPNSVEDDWAEVKDPKEKKRIQNRLAQRTYRQRLKARLMKLQAKVDYNERERLQNGENDDEDGHCGGDDNPSETPRGSTLITDPTPCAPTILHQDHSQLQPQLGYFDGAPDDDAKALYFQSTPFLSGTTTSRSSSQRQLQEPDGNSQKNKTPNDSDSEYLRLSKESQNRHESLSQTSDETQKINVSRITPISRSEHSSQTHDYTSASQEILDFVFSTAMSPWKSDEAHQSGRHSNMSPSIHGALTSPNLALDTQTPDVKTGKTAGNPSGQPESPVTSAKHVSLEEQFDWILECAHDAGFETFDDLVTAYYNTSFSKSSPLSDEQRLSRNRRLPTVVSRVFEAADQWSEWERRGFYEEILKMTESMLRSEAAKARSSIMTKINPVRAAQTTKMAPSGQSILAMKQTITDELPDLWAILMAVATESRPVWQRDLSNTVLASVVLMYGAGRMSNDELLQLVSACL